MGWLRLVGSVELYVSFAKETIELYVSFAKDTMGWLRLVGSIELYVSFAKSPVKKTIFCEDYILRKRPIILRSLPIVATPYLQLHPQQSAHCPTNCILKSQLTTCTVLKGYRADFWGICTRRICCADRVAFCASSIT